MNLEQLEELWEREHEHAEFLPPDPSTVGPHFYRLISDYYYLSNDGMCRGYPQCRTYNCEDPVAEPESEYCDGCWEDMCQRCCYRFNSYRDCMTCQRQVAVECDCIAYAWCQAVDCVCQDCADQYTINCDECDAQLEAPIPYVLDSEPLHCPDCGKETYPILRTVGK